MLLTLIVATPAWWWLAGFLRPGDGLNGWGLSDALHGGAIAAGLILTTALPGLIAAGFLAAAGNPLSGVLSLALAGGIAYHGNALVGVARRAADAGAETEASLYPRLALEMGVGVVVLTLLLAGLQAARVLWGVRVPTRLRSRHLGETVHLLKIDGQSITAGLITAAVGAVLTAALVHSGDPQQVAGGLVLGFTIAALVGHAVTPNHRPWATLMAPAVVGLIGYAWAGGPLGPSHGADALLAALYAHQVPGLGLGLPLHYLTWGVAGCVIGIGIGQVLEHAKLGNA